MPIKFLLDFKFCVLHPRFFRFDIYHDFFLGCISTIYINRYICQPWQALMAARRSQIVTLQIWVMLIAKREVEENIETWSWTLASSSFLISSFGSAGTWRMFCISAKILSTVIFWFSSRTSISCPNKGEIFKVRVNIQIGRASCRERV